MFNNIYKNKKVLITGHTGFKGSWLSMWLLNLGADLVGYSNEIPTNPSHFSALELQNKINHNIGDIRDYKNLKMAMIIFNKFRFFIFFNKFRY